MPDPDDLVSLDVPCDLNAPKVVRDALIAAHDGGWSLDDGLLVASELVTNAVQHSGGTTGHRLCVRVGHRAGRLRIAVHDPGLSGGSAEARVEPAERAHPGGWGLQLVKRVALGWGTERPGGYVVWAELAAHA